MIGGFPAFAPDLAIQGSGFKPEYFDELSAIEASNFWFRERNRLITWAVATYFPQARTLLEIGCGTGFVLSALAQAFPGLTLYGSEIFVSGLGHAAARVPRAMLFQMDARRIPFVDEFDVIGAFDVLEHIAEDETVLSQMHAALKPGGGLVITVPQHRFLWSAQDEYAQHVRRYEAADLVSKLERAGFAITRLTSFVSILLPLMLLSRRRKRSLDATFQPLDELQIGRAANAVLEKVIAMERLLIRHGASLPAGGSLLVVAHRNHRS